MSVPLRVTKDFNGIEKLKATIKSGLYSKSKNIVMICLDLLSDIYFSNKLKHSDCKLTIERFQNSQSTEIGQFTKELLKEIDSPPKKEDSTFTKIILILTPSYTSTIIFIGVCLSIKTIDLYQSTFVIFASVIAVFILGVVLSGAIHYLKVQSKKNVIGIMLGYGLILVFLWLFLNFSFPQSDTKREYFEIP